MSYSVVTDRQSDSCQQECTNQVDTEGSIKPLAKLIKIILTDGIGKVSAHTESHDIVQKGDEDNDRSDDTVEAVIALTQFA